MDHWKSFYWNGYQLVTTSHGWQTSYHSLQKTSHLFISDIFSQHCSMLFTNTADENYSECTAGNPRNTARVVWESFCGCFDNISPPWQCTICCNQHGWKLTTALCNGWNMTLSDRFGAVFLFLLCLWHCVQLIVVSPHSWSSGACLFRSFLSGSSPPVSLP